MSFLRKFWRIPAIALVVALPFVAACADDDGATPPGQVDPTQGTISGTVTSAAGPVIGALVGTSPATNTALTDANGQFVINNVPIPTNPTSYAVTASKEGFQSASATVSLTQTNPTGNVTITLVASTTAEDSTGNLNVLVTNRNGEPQSGADVVVVSAAGDTVATGTTDATGFALFSDLDEGSYTVTAARTISGVDFRASTGVNIAGGETAFAQLVLNRDFGQTVFPNIGGEDFDLAGDAGADIFFVPVPGSEDDDPTVDCNIIRTQHMFIAEVNSGDGDAVSGVKVQWDLNIAGGSFTPPNTGSVVDSDDPDLNPATARSGLSPAFNVDTRKAITFTNDNDQTVTFNGQTVTIGAGQTWILITSPTEGITDVIAFTPDIAVNDPDCANTSPDACDKEFAIKRWVNWETAVAELELTPGFVGDPNLDPGADFDFISDGGLVTNVLTRSDTLCAAGVPPDDPGTGAIECELSGDRFLIYAEVGRLRADSPFTLTSGVIDLRITDDTPDVELIGDEAVDCTVTDGVQNVECNNGTNDDTFTVRTSDQDSAGGEFDALDSDEIGWVVFELRLDEGEFFCVDVNADLVCDPGNVGSPDTFSTATQRLLAGQTDFTNTFVIRFLDDFGEVCDDFTFNKRFVASRLQVIKSTPDAVVRTVTEANGGPDVEPNDTPRPVKTHTIQIGQEFAYTVTAINDGETRSDNVRITDTLPRFGVQFDDVPPDDGAGIMRDGHQAFAYVTDRPAFDPVAVVYAFDDDNDETGDAIDFCIRGDDGSAVGIAYVEPAACTTAGVTFTGSINGARAEAETESAAGHQLVWLQYFDDQILARTDVGGGIQSEDTIEVTLAADESLVGTDGGPDPSAGYPALPGTWCNISTVTDGPGNLDDAPLTTQSLDADTLCHEVREALLDVRKTAEDAVISAGAQAVFTVEIANNGTATLTNVVVNDTLDLVFATSDSLFAEDDIVINTTDFPDATVVVNPDGRTFTVTIGDLPPTDGFVEIFTVSAITPSSEGVFCNRVTVRGQNPAGTLVETDIACVTTTVTIELDIINEDGFIDAGGTFQSAQESFIVGEDIFYQVIITNQSANFTATGVLVVDEVAPTTAAIEFRAVRTGFPTQGTVSGTSDAGFTWNIGSLAPGASAEIQFRAEGVAPQSTVGNRVRLTADQLTGEIVNEEPTTVTQ